MLSPLDRRRRQPVDRSGDRLVAMAGIASSLVFLAASIASLGLPPATRRGLWLPLHLALAGSASTAIAGVLPFFAAAFAAAPPANTPLRIASLVGVAAGAAAITFGVVSGLPEVAVVGGVSFVTGIGLVAGMAILAARTLASGASPTAWAVEPLVGPFVGGWVALAILASATHLVPAIGPGDEAAHARQRRILARLASTRLVVLDVGVAGLSLGVVVARTELALAGAIVLGVGVGATLALLGAALSIGLRFGRRRA